MNNISTKNMFYFQYHFLENCNLRCRHCYQEGYKYYDVELKKCLNIVNQMEKALIKWNKKGRISLTGGEPFINRNILYSLLDYCENSDSFVWTCILTNGTLINEHDLKKLHKYSKLKEIQISLDGASEETHDNIRGKGSFRKSIDNIVRLKKEGFFVSIMFTVHRLNFNEAIDIINLSRKLNVDALTIERVTPCSKEDISELLIDKEKLKGLYNEIYTLKKKIEFNNENLKIRISRPLWNLIDDKAGGFCPVGFTSLAILHDGVVLPCRRMNIPIGNIIDDGIFKIWYTSNVLNKIRNKRLLKGKCNKCEKISRCGGCRAIAYSINKDYMAEDPQCWR